MQNTADSHTEQFITTKSMVLTGLMSALMCVLSPYTIPIGPIPLSLSLLAVYLCIYALGQKLGTLSVLIYLLIGLAGIPVFSGFLGGPARLFGPTGGYLIGYLPLAFICGWFIERFPSKYWPMHIVGMLLGLLVCYSLGTLWFAVSTHVTAGEALAVCVYPFVIWDLIKIATAALVGNTLRRIISLPFTT